MRRLGQFRHQQARVLHDRGDLLVRHARGTDHAQHAAQIAETVLRRDQRERRQPRMAVLAADRDLRRPAVHPPRQQFREQVALLGELDQVLQLRPARELRLVGEHARPPQPQVLARQLARRQQVLRRLHEDVQQLRCLRIIARRIPQPRRQRRPDLAQAEPGQPLVQHGRHRAHRLRRHRHRNVHVDRADAAVLEREDEQDPLARDMDQVELLQHHFLQARRHRHSQLARDQPQRLRRPMHQPLQRPRFSRLRQLPPHPPLLRRRQPHRPHQRVHVVAVRQVRRDPSRRRVRVEQEALFLQVGHRVADRRRGHAEPVTLRHRAAPRRLRRLHVRPDHRLEDPLLAFVQRR